MKVCRECHQEKPIEEFYKHFAMADGYLNKCISCVKERVKNYREANLERIQAYDRKRGMLPHKVEQRKVYAKTESGKQAIKKARLLYQKRYPLAYAAHIVTGNAIRDKKLIKSEICSVCESTTDIEAHHDDYTKPLDVRWLCSNCHDIWHKHNKPIYE